MLKNLMFKLIDARRAPALELPFLCYFVEGRDIPEDLRLRFGGNFMRRVVTGPGDVTGLLIYAGSGFLEYDPERYDFKKCGKGRYLGFRRDFAPEMALRASLYRCAGYQVKMANGESYMIPVAAPTAPNYSLPRVNRIGETGEWEYSPADDALYFLHFAAEKMFDAMQGDGTVAGFDNEQLRRVAVEAIRANYDLSELEIGARAILDDGAVAGIIESLLDAPAIKEISAQKKTLDN